MYNFVMFSTAQQPMGFFLLRMISTWGVKWGFWVPPFKETPKKKHFIVPGKKRINKQIYTNKTHIEPINQPIILSCMYT